MMGELLKLMPDFVKGIIDLVEDASDSKLADFEQVCDILIPNQALKSRVRYIIEQAKARRAFQAALKEQE